MSTKQYNPCPFCEVESNMLMMVSRRVSCENCGCTGPSNDPTGNKWNAMPRSPKKPVKKAPGKPKYNLWTAKDPNGFGVVFLAKSDTSREELKKLAIKYLIQDIKANEANYIAVIDEVYAFGDLPAGWHMEAHPWGDWNPDEKSIRGILNEKESSN